MIYFTLTNIIIPLGESIPIKTAMFIYYSLNGKLKKINFEVFSFSRQNKTCIKKFSRIKSRSYQITKMFLE